MARAESAQRELARRRLIKFALYVEPTFRQAKHLDYLAGKLERVRRRECKRLMIFAPPRHGKSKLMSELFPAWALGVDPSEQFMICSASQSLSDTFSRNVRNLISSEPYAEIFPNTQLSADSATVQKWTLAGFTRPAMLSIGVGGNPMGQGARTAIVDDPFGSAAEFESIVTRNNVYQWYTDTLRNRLEPDAAIVLGMQRGHDDELAGRLIRDSKRGGEQWEIVILPAIAEAQSERDAVNTQMYSLPAGLPDPLGREPGTPLWPERWPLAELQAIKSVSQRSFDAKYQQRPRPAEGALFKRPWFNDKIINGLPSGLRWFRFYDTAYSVKQTADNTATISAAMADDGTVYFRRGRAGRMETPDTRAMIKSYVMAETDSSHGVEKTLHGGGVVQDLLRDRELAGKSIRAVEVDGDKMVRATPLADRAEMGKVCFVRESVNDDGWIADFIDELCAFPYGAHDDRVDACSGAFGMISNTPGWVAYAREQTEKMKR